ncbi:hypothetical protein CIPAW_07G174900 [Carya illinoinensis]|uniref:Uncharacterized protein n=1 Tax=Carya illinoinensis TaxID=32201 RepID=A0A8T1PXB7_CARIL|nr:hypothetical protein CIPAW_07G174900 [Carya illinoinensis]
MTSVKPQLTIMFQKKKKKKNQILTRIDKKIIKMITQSAIRTPKNHKSYFIIYHLEISGTVSSPTGGAKQHRVIRMTKRARESEFYNKPHQSFEIKGKKR